MRHHSAVRLLTDNAFSSPDRDPAQRRLDLHQVPASAEVGHVTSLPPGDLPPDDLPKSPSGRTPQWVRDQAAGRELEPTPWRAAPSTFRPDIEPRRRRQRVNAVSTIVVSALLVAGFAWTWTGHRLGPPSTTRGADAAETAPPAASAGRRTSPPLGLEEAKAPLGAPAPLDRTSASYRFQLIQPETTATPVAFSPCRPVHYVVRPDNSPAGGGAVIARAVAAVSSATGLRFVDDGSTSEPIVSEREPYQPKRYGDRWAPVLIAWATPDEVPDFGVDIAGEGGAQWVSTRDGAHFYVTGQVYLDAAKARRMRHQGMPRVVQEVVEHELGHLVGLAHVNDSTQIMYPRASKHVLEYQAGDVTGLAALGRGACSADV